MPDVTMPRLSDSMEEGTILRWLVEDGAEVSRGDEIAEIETDKATMTYEADASGEFRRVASEGDTLAIGEVIARIGEGSAEGDGAGDGGAPAGEGRGDGESGDGPGEGRGGGESADPSGGDREEGESPADGRPDPPRAAVAQDDSAQDDSPSSAPAAARSGQDGGNGRIKASPIARRLARDRGVDLASVEGTGPGGRIVKADVESAEPGAAREERRPEERAGEEEAPRPAPAEQAAAQAAVSERGTAKGDVTVQELSRTQQLIARRMAESKATVPEFTLQAEIDMERCVELRAQLKEAAASGDPVPSYNDMVVKACARALREFPRANGAYRDGRFELYSRVNVGVAVAAQDALVVPTVFDADRRTLGEIARETRELARKVREGQVTPPELSGGTFTVSNLGMYGVSNFTAVINPPQAAILAVGAMTARPVVHDDQIVVRHRMEVTLACDHRILYGADAAEFLARIRALLEQPLLMAL